MKLTIVLLTKGRMPYLVEALQSYEKFIQFGLVEVLLIDNGSDSESTQVLLNWKVRHKDKVHYFRNEINNPAGLTYFWDIIESCNPDWILNPGDDDILEYEAYLDWRETLEKNPFLNAFAASASIINESGRNTGEIKSPAIINTADNIEVLARSLNQPPFFWPSLYFRFATIHKPVVISRFVHDWWIGLQLVIAGQVHSTQSIGVKYRVHGNQESHQVPSRRKYFEGFNMLSDFIRGHEFQSTIKKLTDLDKEKFFDLCTIEKPLYSQPHYSLSLIKELADILRETSVSQDSINSISEKFALSAGVYTKKSDLNNLYTGYRSVDLNNEGSNGNFSLVFSSEVCAELNSVRKFFSESNSTKVIIRCNHSNLDFKSLLVDCSKFKRLSELEISELVLIMVNKQLEIEGKLSFTSTQFERNFILFIRRIRSRFPRLVSIIKRVWKP